VASEERRRTSRLALKVPILLRWGDGAKMREARTVSRDVSSHGVYFSLPEIIKDGTTIEIEMTLPSHSALSGPARVRCVGRVQRCEQEEGAKTGMAVSINKYEFIYRSGEAPSEKDLCLISQD
jgi:hypothetical protein